MKRWSVKTKALLFAALAPALAVCLLGGQSLAQDDSGGWCPMRFTTGDTKGLYAALDFNAGYTGYNVKALQGEKVVMRSGFPHARYLSMVLYDEDFMIVDAIRDVDIVPLSGENPFRPGVDRSRDDLGEFEITVMMAPPPEGEAPPNTLYGGLNHEGREARSVILGYRVYLPDEKYRDTPDGFAGISAPVYRVYKTSGDYYCPTRRAARSRMYRSLLKMLGGNMGQILQPNLGYGEPASPPAWYNSASRDSQRSLDFVPNDQTAYVMAPISGKHGELLVLRWRAPRTPQQTYQGGAFPEDYDMRYWSLNFNRVDRSRVEVVVCEKTVADVEVPVLPDGTRQLVIGFNGMDRPDFVSQDQWVGLEMKEGLIVMRNILIDPAYPGSFWDMPPGPIEAENDKYVPGGVYCSASELEENPDLGLGRSW